MEYYILHPIQKVKSGIDFTLRLFRVDERLCSCKNTFHYNRVDYNTEIKCGVNVKLDFFKLNESVLSHLYHTNKEKTKFLKSKIKFVPEFSQN